MLRFGARTSAKLPPAKMNLRSGNGVTSGKAVRNLKSHQVPCPTQSRVKVDQAFDILKTSKDKNYISCLCNLLPWLIVKVIHFFSVGHVQQEWQIHTGVIFFTFEKWPFPIINAMASCTRNTLGKTWLDGCHCNASS